MRREIFLWALLKMVLATSHQLSKSEKAQLPSWLIENQTSVYQAGIVEPILAAGEHHSVKTTELNTSSSGARLAARKSVKSEKNVEEEENMILQRSLNSVHKDKEHDILEGRGRLKKILIPVLLAVTIVAAIILPALMSVIKLIAVKGLWSGVVSLIITKLIGIKSFLDHHHLHSDQNQRPYLVYLPHGHGKWHRREEEENVQYQRQPYDQWEHQGDWDEWRRNGGNVKL